MTLPGKSANEVAAMDAKGRREYFANYARYQDDVPWRFAYAIRVGSEILFASTVENLLRRFEEHVEELGKKEHAKRRRSSSAVHQVSGCR